MEESERKRKLKYQKKRISKVVAFNSCIGLLLLIVFSGVLYSLIRYFDTMIVKVSVGICFALLIALVIGIFLNIWKLQFQYFKAYSRATTEVESLKVSCTDAEVFVRLYGGFRIGGILRFTKPEDRLIGVELNISVSGKTEKMFYIFAEPVGADRVAINDDYLKSIESSFCGQLLLERYKGTSAIATVKKEKQTLL